MNKYQKRALAHPVYFNFETVHPRFGRKRPTHTEILTVDAGWQVIEMNYGGPVWHASCASLSMSHDNLEIRVRTHLLTGLGEHRLGEWVQRRETNGIRVVHIWRRMTRSEENVVGPLKDLRNTRQQINRANAVGRQVNLHPLALMEMG